MTSFSIQDRNFNKRFDATLSFDCVSNIIFSQVILRIGDCSLLLILIAITFYSLISSAFGLNVKITSHYKHHEDFNKLPTDSIPLDYQQLIYSYPDKLTIIYLILGCYIHFGPCSSPGVCYFSTLSQNYGMILFHYYSIFTNEVQV